jgi:hypothetical protein
MLYEADLQYMLFPLKQRYWWNEEWHSEKPPTVKILYQQLQGMELKPAQSAAQVNHSS